MQLQGKRQKSEQDAANMGSLAKTTPSPSRQLHLGGIKKLSGVIK